MFILFYNQSAILYFNRFKIIIRNLCSVKFIICFDNFDHWYFKRKKVFDLIASENEEFDIFFMRGIDHKLLVIMNQKLFLNLKIKIFHLKVFQLVRSCFLEVWSILKKHTRNLFLLLLVHEISVDYYFYRVGYSHFFYFIIFA